MLLDLHITIIHISKLGGLNVNRECLFTNVISVQNVNKTQSKLSHQEK